MEGALLAIEGALGHRFRDRSLLVNALTHRSFANESKDPSALDNERLEFLGDAVLGYLVSVLLCERYPAAREGELTQRRADIVREASLAVAARHMDLGAVLRMGRGEDQSGGRTKGRLLACALEACIGAVYLDGGEAAAKATVARLFGDLIEGSEPGATDYKSRLQEHVQGRGGPTPTYELVEQAGPDHQRLFRVRVRAGDTVTGEGEGRSKVEAEQAAAQAALGTLVARDRDPGEAP